MKWMTFVLAAVLALGVAGCGDKEKIKVNTEGGGKLEVTLPKSQTLRPGEANEVTVKIDRKNLDEDVSVKFEGLPDGVTVDKPDQKIEKGKDEGKFVLMVGAKAKPVENHKVKVTASAKGTSGTGEFGVTIKESKE